MIFYRRLFYPRFYLRIRSGSLRIILITFLVLKSGSHILKQEDYNATAVYCASQSQTPKLLLKRTQPNIECQAKGNVSSSCIANVYPREGGKVKCLLE